MPNSRNTILADNLSTDADPPIRMETEKMIPVCKERTSQTIFKPRHKTGMFNARLSYSSCPHAVHLTETRRRPLALALFLQVPLAPLHYLASAFRPMGTRACFGVERRSLRLPSII